MSGPSKKQGTPKDPGPRYYGKPIIGRDIFTTGQVAAMFCVAPRTVSKWIDTGKLRGHRIPHGMDRRISLKELIWFANFHALPLPEWLSTQVILCGVPKYLHDIPVADWYTPTTTSTLVEAALAMNRNARRVVVVLDTSLGRAETLAAGVQFKNTCNQVRTLALAGEDEVRVNDFNLWNFDGVLVHPVQPDKLLHGIEKLMALTRRVAAQEAS